jgi:dihydroxy-acid dehydratase
VTGKTLAENLAGVELLPLSQGIIARLDRPFAPAGNHIIVLKGNLCPGGAVIKLSGKELKHFRGPARCFDSEVNALAAIVEGRIVAGVIVLCFLF